MRAEELIRAEINSCKSALPLPMAGKVLERVILEARIRALEWVINGTRVSAVQSADKGSG
jgi:hypothetical protein